MMDKVFEVKVNTGSLFSSPSKKFPTSPDYFGEVKVAANLIKVVDGAALIKISGWKKQAKNGKTYLSLSVKDPSLYKESLNEETQRETREEDPFQ